MYKILCKQTQPSLKVVGGATFLTHPVHILVILSFSQKFSRYTLARLHSITQLRLEIRSRNNNNNFYSPEIENNADRK